jgi:hypothetical protein
MIPSNAILLNVACPCKISTRSLIKMFRRKGRLVRYCGKVASDVKGVMGR